MTAEEIDVEYRRALAEASQAYHRALADAHQQEADAMVAYTAAVERAVKVRRDAFMRAGE